VRRDHLNASAGRNGLQSCEVIVALVAADKFEDSVDNVVDKCDSRGLMRMVLWNVKVGVCNRYIRSLHRATKCHFVISLTSRRSPLKFNDLQGMIIGLIRYLDRNLQT
jgi:hypothetical protein